MGPKQISDTSQRRMGRVDGCFQLVAHYPTARARYRIHASNYRARKSRLEVAQRAPRIPSTFPHSLRPTGCPSGRGYAMATPTFSAVMVEDTLPCILPQDWPLYYPPKQTSAGLILDRAELKIVYESDCQEGEE
jgi:hypothetical protein